VTRVVAGGLAVALRFGAFAIDAVLFAALAGGSIGVVGPLKEIGTGFFSGSASEAEVMGGWCGAVAGTERAEERASFCVELAAGFSEAGGSSFVAL